MLGNYFRLGERGGLIFDPLRIFPCHVFLVGL